MERGLGYNPGQSQSSMPTRPTTILPWLISSLLTGLILCFTAGCGNGSGGATVITVFAAASLTDAFREFAREFESANPGIEVKLNFAGSQRLRSQLEFGASADVFASADAVQMDLAKDAGLIAGSARPFAGSGLAVIVPVDSHIQDVSEIADPGVKLVLSHESVPAGRYSRLLLARLSEPDAGLGADFGDRTLANVASDETSVKFVEQKVVLGEADAGIVYRSGALTAIATGSARELPLPPAADEVRALYPIAALGNSAAQEWSEKFVEFVLSRHAREILSSYGFDAP